jgi:hypothetical protein
VLKSNIHKIPPHTPWKLDEGTMPIMLLGNKNHFLGIIKLGVTVYIFPNDSNIINKSYACMFHHSEENYTQINRKVILN